MHLLSLFQNNLDSANVKDVLKDFPSEEKLLSEPQSKDSTTKDKLKKTYEKTIFLRIVKKAVGHSMDLVKDIFLLCEFALSQGGISAILNQKVPYMAGVS